MEFEVKLFHLNVEDSHIVPNFHQILPPSLDPIT